MRVVSKPVQTSGTAPVHTVTSTSVPPATSEAPSVAPSHVPSAAEFAARKPGATASTRAFELHLQALREPEAPVAAPTDGIAFSHRALQDIRQRTSRGEKVRVVFDLDNTLFDTRARTVAVAKAWDQANGTQHFAGLTLADVGRDGRHTCERLGLPPDVTDAFAAHWDVAFWDGANMVHDTPMPHTGQLARAAKAAGADVVYLTGRIADLQGASLAQLVRAGLPDADTAHLFCKPGLITRTAPFKAEMMQAWQDAGFHLAFFVTEGRRDIAHLQAETPSVACLLLDDPLEHGGAALHPDTPVLPANTPLVR